MGLTEFLGHAISDLIDNRIRIKFIPQRQLTYNPGKIVVSGYFCETNKNLTVCTKSETWWYSFMHEYCHFLQWKEDSFSLLEYNEYNLDNWYDNKTRYKIPEEKAYKLTKVYSDCEVDCEKRVINLARQWNLDIDETDYIQQANAYILTYPISFQLKKWFNTSPYKIQELIDITPSVWLDDYMNVPEDFKELAINLCYNKKEK